MKKLLFVFSCTLSILFLRNVQALSISDECRGSYPNEILFQIYCQCIKDPNITAALEAKNPLYEYEITDLNNNKLKRKVSIRDYYMCESTFPWTWSPDNWQPTWENGDATDSMASVFKETLGSSNKKSPDNELCKCSKTAGNSCVDKNALLKLSEEQRREFWPEKCPKLYLAQKAKDLKTKITDLKSAFEKAQSETPEKIKNTLDSLKQEQSEATTDKARKDEITTRLSAEPFKGNDEKIKNIADESQPGVTDFRKTLMTRFNEAKNSYFQATQNQSGMYQAISDYDLLRMGKSIGKFNVTNMLKMSDESTESKLEIISEDGSDSNKNNFLDRIIRFIAMTIGTFGIALLITGALFMIFSAGDENRLQKGKQIVMYTISGLIVAFLSYTIVQFILAVLFKLE